MKASAIYEGVRICKKQNSHMSVASVLHILEASPSGYYKYLKHQPSAAQKHREALKKQIKTIYKDSHEVYGAPKITAKLHQEGEHVCQRTVQSLMKEMHIRAHYIKPYTRTTISRDFSNNLKNILNRKFNPERPNAVWVTDITYIWTQEDGFVYLTSVMDLYSRKIIAWVMTRTMEAKEVLKCIEIAKRRRTIDKPLIVHSDRGIQYTSAIYRKITDTMTRSYSKKGTPWDNACIESFHACIKREWLNGIKIRNFYQAKDLVFEYIEGFYNTVRIHSHCGYKSPNEYEKAFLTSEQNSQN